MIAILGRTAPPDEVAARRALAALSFPATDVALRRLGNALLGVATQPDLVDATLSSDGPVIAALVGRIDNAATLHGELAAAGRTPASARDADVVVATFRAHGTAGVNRLRGAFAGVLTDGATVWCFRDHVGFRGLCYRDGAGAFVAASEARPVAVAAGITEEPDLEVLEALFYGDTPSSMPAALKGISRLAQGAVLTAGAQTGATQARYWKPRDLLETARLGEAEACERFLALLSQATERCLTGRDVVLLSGGLDSPAVAAFAAPQHLRRFGRPLGALSVVFPHLPAVDERSYTELVAQRFGMPLDTYVTSARTLDDVDAWSQRLGTPVPVLSVPEVWEAYSRARALGYRNVLTGEFAELVYGKYPHLLAHLLLRGRGRTLARIIRAEHARGASRRELLLDALTGLVPGRVVNWSIARRGHGPQATIPAWMDRTRFDLRTPRPDYVVPARERWRSLQLWGTQGSTIAMEADASIAGIAGVTIRRPLADVDLWEFFLSLRAEVKFPVLQWKALARRALRGVVPDEILDRPRKTVFDEHVMQQVDYPTLERFLVAPRHRIGGVDYELLAERIRRRELGFHEWLRARELCRVHAFLSAW